MTTRQEQAEYMALCEFAWSLGLDISLDSPDAPKTVAGLHAAVANACESEVVKADSQEQREYWQHHAAYHWDNA